MSQLTGNKGIRCNSMCQGGVENSKQKILNLSKPDCGTSCQKR